MVIFGNNLQAEAVVFDFDGIIVDTEPLHFKAFQEILGPLGLGFSWDDYVATYMGFDDRDAFMEAFRSRGRAIDHDHLIQLIAEKAATFLKIISSGVTAYPGVCELIRSLHARQTPLAICSGALRSDVMPILKSLAILECFEILVSADEVAKSKPDPESYHLAFQRMAARWPHLQLTPQTTVAIEDTPAGIQAASKAGLQVIGVTNSYGRERLNQATLVVDSLEGLLRES